MVILISLTAGIIAVILPNFIKCHCGGSLTACKSNCKNLATALEMYASDNAGWYPDQLSDLLPGNYLKVLPTCPEAKAMSYTDYVAFGNKSFRFSCVGNNHVRAYTGFSTCSNNYPQYSGEEGLLDHP